MCALTQHKTREFTSVGNPGFKGKGKFPYIRGQGNISLHKGSGTEADDIWAMKHACYDAA